MGSLIQKQKSLWFGKGRPLRQERSWGQGRKEVEDVQIAEN